jgi:hypothetical protein
MNLSADVYSIAVLPDGQFPDSEKNRKQLKEARAMKEECDWKALFQEDWPSIRHKKVFRIRICLFVVASGSGFASNFGSGTRSDFGLGVPSK